MRVSNRREQLTMTALPDAGDVFAGPGPVEHPETQPFWDSLGDGMLRLQQCEQCGTVRFPLAPVCHQCLSPGYHWIPVGGGGQVHAAVLIERATSDPAWRDAVPFRTGLVTLDSGLRLPGRIFCGCGAAARPGTPVTLCSLRTVNNRRIWGFMHACPVEGARS
jgi:uncharacterized OB-fold protein